MAHPLKYNATTDHTQDTDYGDSSAKLWSLYLSEADKYDRGLADTWKEDTNGILIFTGLFSATVAAFAIESYKGLHQDSVDVTNSLLTQILARQSSSTISKMETGMLAPINAPFVPPSSSVRVNVLWFTSLILSLTCALAATLIQQWVRVYMRADTHTSVLHRRGHLRAFVFEGLQRFKVAAALEAIPAIMHLSLFLFFAGLVEFMKPINRFVANVLLGVVCMCGASYAVLTILPIIYIDCPFQSPFTKTVWRMIHLVQLMRIKFAQRIAPATAYLARKSRSFNLPSYNAFLQDCRERLYGGMEKWQETAAYRNHDVAVGIDCRALQRALTLLDHEEAAEPFIEGIPGFLHSFEARDPSAVIVHLLSSKLLGTRLSTLLHSCVTARALPMEEARRRRALTCLRAVWHLTERLGAEWLNRWFSVQTELRAYTFLRDDRDPSVAVHALCTTSLAAHGFLANLRGGTLRPFFPDTECILEDIVDIITTLIGPSPSLTEECANLEDMTRNGHIVNLITFVLRLLPFLQTESLAEADVSLAFDTLRILSATETIGGDEASLDVQVALLRLCTEEMSDIWDDDVTLDVSGAEPPFVGVPPGGDDVAKLAEVLLPLCASLSPEAHTELEMDQTARSCSPVEVGSLVHSGRKFRLGVGDPIDDPYDYDDEEVF
ncbi:hypothetical protein OF83DRAFT_1170800 [Amylostereum chailletii]|nr:hypothetical protein OF83DRAFT_1170800 [Amylostereum chailletii]